MLEYSATAQIKYDYLTIFMRGTQAWASDFGIAPLACEFGKRIWVGHGKCREKS